MKRRIALLLVFYMLTTMLPPALAEEIVQIPNSADATLELPGDADGIVEDGLPVLDLGDVDPLQLDLGDLEQTDIEPENIPGEEGESGEADARDGGADNATAAGVPKTLTLGQKQTYAIDASKVSGGKTVTYKSSKATVATVSKKGVITAKKNGTAKITLTVGKKTVATCTVTVVNAPGNVTLPASSITLDVKATYQIKPKLPNKTMASFTYSSADKKIAKVSKEGLVTGLKVGSTTITVKTHNNKTAELSVTVKATEPTEAGKVTLSQTKATLSMGDTLQLTATLPKGTASVLTWTSDKPAVAKVNDYGLVTAEGAGTAKITVATANGKKASCTVTVNKAPGKVTVKPTAVTLAPGESIQLKATLPKGTTSELTWKSAKSAVAKVNENGLVTAVKAGTAKITVETNNGKKDTCVVTVKKNGGDDDAKAPKKVTLDQTKATLSAGDTLQLVATLPAGTVSSLTWTSDNTKVAKVKSTGLVTAVGAGTAKITVTTANKKKATCTLTVKKAPESVTLNAHELIIGVGETFLLRTTLLPKGATSDLTWKSNKASVVKVNEDGMITAVKAGTAKITVETYNGKKDTCKVTVEKAALLRAYTDQASFSILPTNNAKLQVKTEVKRDPELTYKWYLGKTEITGATGTEYTVTADKVGSYAYKCVVSDGTNSQDVAFTVTVDNGLTAKASSAAEQTIYTKQETTLSVTAECSVGKPTYQWYEGDTVIDGATSASYAATKADAGDYTYKCVVSDGYGSTAEVGFTVTVKARTLTDATAQTASFSLKPGDKATLKVNVTTDGEPGLTYKWYLGENEITGANAASYAVTAGNVGSYAYKCVVTDDSAKKNSKTVSFTVTVANGLSAKASSATEQTVYTGKAATLSVTASASTNDKLSYQWYEGDTAISGATKASYAATKASAGSYAYKCVVSDGYGSTAEVGFTVTVKAPSLTGATADKADVTVAPKGTATLKVNVTTDGEPTLTYKWFEGTTEITGATGASYAVTAGNVGEYTYKCQVSDGTNSKEVSFTVTVDNGFTARASSATEQTAFTGKAATLSVTASATTNDKLSYQWYEGDTAISGATSASYAATKASAGSTAYKCVVSDGYGSEAVTLSFTVTVKEPKLTGATADKEAVTVAPKGTATLKVNVTVDGEPALSYKWYLGETAIEGATGAEYTVTAGNVGSYAYKCVVSDDSTTQYSATVDFTVTVNNGFAAEATSATEQTVFTGKAAALSVTASATVDDTLSYQWYEGDAAITGATADSYSATKADAGNYTYKCVVSDGYGSTAEVGFTVTVKEPTLTEATADKAAFTVAPKGTATLKVNTTVEGEPGLSYQWYEGESTQPIAGADTDSYDVTAGDVGEYAYRCVVTDDSTTQNSKTVDFTVSVANAFAAQADGETTLNIYTGETATMSVTASATVADKISYQWYAGETAISGATAASYTTGAIADAGEHAYRCVVSDGYGSEAVTVSITVTVKAPSLTEATAETASFALKPTEQATLKVVTECDGEPTLSYTWFAGETKIDGETADSYALTAGDVGEYTYKCQVSDGTKTSAVTFTVTVANAFAAQADGETTLNIYTGATATMSVTASATVADKISYQWYAEDAKIEDATAASYTTGAIAAAGEYAYKCVVGDGYGSEAVTVNFTVTAKAPSLTEATAETAGFALKPTEQATLKVVTECDGEPTLTYTWFVGETKIDGETADSYVLTAGNVGEYTYKCQVSDGTNTKEVPFTVTVDNAFSAQVKGEAAKTVFMGAAATLEVEAACATGDKLSYKWTRTDAPETVLGTEAAYTTAALDTVGAYGYTCEVNDGYGSAAATLSFTVNVVNTPELTAATAVQAAFTVAPTGSATLEVQTECAGAPTLTYAWYAGEAADPIDGANEASYAVTEGNVGEYTYKCQVSDGTNTRDVTFTVTVDNGLTASASGEAELTVAVDEAAELAVEADCTTGAPTYRWFEGENSEPIEGAESASYSVTKAEAGTYTYRCEVGDAYGSAVQSVAFTVTVTDGSAVEGVAINAENFPDPVFREIVKRYDDDSDLVLSKAEAESVTSLWDDDCDLSNLEGIEYFTELTSLNCSRNSRLTSLDLSHNTKLRYLYVNDCGLTELDVSANTELRYLYCQYNKISELNLANCSALTDAIRYGDIYTNHDWDEEEDVEKAEYTVYSYDDAYLKVDNGVELKGIPEPAYIALDETNFPDAAFRSCVKEAFDTDEDNRLSEREIGSAANLTCEGGDLTSLKGIEILTQLVELNASTSKDLTTVDLSHNGKLRRLYLNGCGLTVLDISGNTQLETLFVQANSLTELDLGGCGKLIESAMTEPEEETEDGHAYLNYRGRLKVDATVALKGLPTVSEDWPTIRLDEATTVNIANPGDKVFFSFVPAETGTFHFYDCDYYPIGYLYDANLKQLMSTEATDEEEYWEDEGFSLKCDLTEGLQYYFATRFIGSETGSYEVCLTQIKGLQRAWAEETYISVAPNEPATLVVNVENIGDGALTSVWYDADNNAIEGAEGLTYTIESVTRSGNYRCKVSDTFGHSDEVWFTVTVDNGFTVSAVGSTSLMVASGESAELKVAGSVNLGSIHYQWETERYDEEEERTIWEPVAGETGATFTTPVITDSCMYQCRVSDDYGNTRRVRFGISVGKSMDGDVFEVTMRNASNDEPVTDNKLMVGNDLRIYIDTTGKPEDIGDDLSGWARLYTTGANEVEIASDYWYDDDDCNFTLNLSDVEPGSYKLRLKLEAYGYMPWEKDIDFTIDSLGELAAPAFTVESGSGAFLTYEIVAVRVDLSNAADGVSYWVDIYPNADDRTYSMYGSNAVDEEGVFWFNVPIQEAPFVVRVSTKKEGWKSGISEKTFTPTNYGQLPKPEFNLIPAGNGYTLTYTNWPDAGDVDSYAYLFPADGEGGYVEAYWVDKTTHTSDIRLDEVESGNYVLRVGYYADGYYWGTAEDYPITVENHGALDAPEFALDQEVGRVVLGSKLVVTIRNRPEDVENVSYTAKIYPTYNEYDVYAEAEYDSEAGTLTFERLSGLREDEFNLVVTASALGYTSGKHSQAITVVRIDNQLTAEAIGDTERHVALNATETLEVNASCDKGGIYYQWYKDDEPIEGATASSYTTEAITGYTRYYCNVTDDYGSSCSVWFYVSVENHLSVQDVGGGTARMVVPGKDVTLEASVTADRTDGIIRKWSVRVDDETGWHWENIAGETGDTLVLENVTESNHYECEAADAFGNTAQVVFTVNVVDLNNVTTLTLGEPQTVSIEGYDGDCELFSFEPEASGWYAFIGDEAHVDGSGKYGALLDAELNQISIADQNTSFKLMCQLTAGARYYFMTGYTPGYGDGSYEVVLERNEALDNIQPLTLGEASAVNIAEGGQTVYFSFTPEETGYYAFSSSGSEDYSTIGAVYDGNFKAIKEETGWNDFSIANELIQGNTYYFSAKFNNEGAQGAYTVCLKRFQGLVNADAEQTYFSVEPNTEVTLRVNAVCTEGETLTYQWYLGDAEEPISGANGSTYAVTVTRSNNYRCVVSDTRGQTKEVRFSAYVENELKARVKGSEDWNTEVDLTASMKEEVSLEVEASCKNGALHYKWLDNGNEIEGANSPAYTTKPIHSERTEMSCIVSDDYGNTNWVNFHIDCDNYVDNNLQASAENENINVSPAGTATLKVNATAVDMEGVTYSWSYQSKALNDAGGLDEGEWMPIEDATGATCILDGTDMYTTSYRCEVADQYDAVQTVWFNVTVENELRVDPDNDNTVHPTAYNTSATLVVTADAIDKTGLTYTWIEAIYGEGAEESTVRAVEGGNTSTLVTEPLIRESRFECRVVDRFWNSAEFGFSVGVPNGLTASAANNETTILVLSGQPAVLAVAASCLNGQDQLRYRWERFEGKDEWGGEMWQPIDSADTPEYRIEAVTENTRARCVVTDICNNTEWVDFTVNVVDPNNVTALTLGEPQNVSIEGYDGKYELFSFEPEASGWYAFIGDEAHVDGSGKYGALLDAELNQISIADQNTSFKLMCQLTEGTRYYFMTGYTPGYGDGAYDVVLKRDETLDNIQSLTLSAASAVNIAEGGQTVYFSYTPTETGYYIFSSDYDGTNGTFGTLYDGHFQELRGESGYNNFCIIQRLDSENTYYFGARFSDETVVDSFTVSLKAYEGLISANAAESSFTVAPNTEVTLQVNAEYTDGESLTYRWYEDGGYDTASESTVSTYTLNATRATIYRCEVKDTHGNTRSVDFWVNIENSFTASAIGETECTASMGDTVSFEVEASCVEGVPSYQWVEDGYEIEGANSAAYTTKPIHRERTEVYCRVSDDYGNTSNVWFYINCEDYVENNLQAYAANESIYAYPEDLVTLEAGVSAVDLADATAQWFYRPRTLNDQGEWDEGEWVHLGAPEAITAEDGQATVTRTLGDGELHTTGYRCEIVDKYGNTADTGFNVTVETGLSMTWDYEHSSFSVVSGAAATLTSQMQKNWEPTTVTGLDYTWYRRNGDYYEIIDDQTGASYTIPSVTRREDYKCVAVDAYWNKYDRSDYVGVENELSVRAANSETIFAVPYGGRVTLAVEASCTEGQDALQYKWSGWKLPNGGNVEFTESTDSSYVIDSVTENWGYKCDITDIYGNTRDVEFSVTIIDPNDATSLTANSPVTSVPESNWAEGILWSYTPQETGSYIFRVTGNSTGTPVYCALYNADMNKITRAEKYGDATLAVNLTGGEEYFFKAGYTIRYGGEDPITVELISMSNTSALTLGEAVAVNLTEGGQIVCFSFTPIQTGRYVFESFTDGDSYEDTYGILYDGNMQEIANDDSTGENGHFKLVHELSADTTYYFATRYYNCDGKGAFSVRLTTEE